MVNSLIEYDKLSEAFNEMLHALAEDEKLTDEEKLEILKEK